MRDRHHTLSDIKDMLVRVNTNLTGIFSRAPEPIAILSPEIAVVIGDTHIHISEFIIAKIQGRIRGMQGHPEIIDEIFVRLPHNLSDPQKIVIDKRFSHKYLFITTEPDHVIVVEVRRLESGKTEINTIYPIGDKEKRRLERFQIAFPLSGGTPTPSYMPHP